MRIFQSILSLIDKIEHLDLNFSHITCAAFWNHLAMII
jgi:hypothetical protein